MHDCGSHILFIHVREGLLKYQSPQSTPDQSNCMFVLLNGRPSIIALIRVRIWWLCLASLCNYVHCVTMYLVCAPFIVLTQCFATVGKAT